MTNWKGMQVFGCRKPGFEEPKDVLPGYMAGGCWHANLSKDGARWKRSSGAAPAAGRKQRGKRKISVLPSGVITDKKGYVVCLTQ